VTVSSDPSRVSNALPGPVETLRYRRQFVLGPRYVDRLSFWNRAEVRPGIRVTAHPELPITQAKEGKRSVTLLGFLLDPDRPEASNEGIVLELLRRLAEAPGEEPYESTSGLGGRWVLITDDGERVRLFHDAMGLREVHWVDPAVAGDVWAASQPAPLTELLPLRRDPRAESEYVSSDVYREWSEYRWPADTSVYTGVRRLLPNHALDLLGGRVRRYWPDRPLGSLSLDEGTKASSDLLTGLIQAASRRFPLALATTAGWDTRLMLAGSRAVAPKLHFFTRNRTENPADVTTAPRLVRKLGFVPHLIPLPESMSPEFGAIYRGNVTEAHVFWGRMAEGMSKSWPAGYVSMTGNAAEIVRVRLRMEPGEVLSARLLARLMSTADRFQDRLENIPFVVEAWQRWLDGLGELHGIDPLDLFYWECHSGAFAAPGGTEYDIVYETFTPHDCRRLLTTMLAVDERYREHDHPKLYVTMIRRMWPELLSEPVNQRYEGKWTPVLRALRRVGIRRLVPAGARQRLRRALGVR